MRELGCLLWWLSGEKKETQQEKDCLICGNLSDLHGVPKVQGDVASGAQDIPGWVEWVQGTLPSS